MRKNVEIINIVSKLSKGEVLMNGKEIIYTPQRYCNFIARLGDVIEPASILDVDTGIGELLAPFAFKDYVKQMDGYCKKFDVISKAKSLVPEANFINKDFLITDVHEKYDLIVGHIFYGDFRRYGNELKIFNNEATHLKKMLELLNPGGYIACILTQNFLEDDKDDDYRKIKKCIIDKYSLEMVVELPNRFNGMHSSFILIKNSKQRDKVYIERYYNNSEEIIENYIEESGYIWIEKDLLSERWDRKYNVKKVPKNNLSINDKKYLYLLENIEILRGYLSLKSMKNKIGRYAVFDCKHIKEGHLVRTDDTLYWDDKFMGIELKPGDIVVDLFFNSENLVYEYKKSDPPTKIDARYAIIRSKNNRNIQEYLKNEKIKKSLEEHMRMQVKYAGKNYLSQEDIERIVGISMGFEDIFYKPAEKEQNDEKTVIEEYKQQIIDLEKRKNILQMEKDNLEKEKDNLKNEISNLRQEKSKQAEEKVLIEMFKVREKQEEREEIIPILKNIQDRIFYLEGCVKDKFEGVNKKLDRNYEVLLDIKSLSTDYFDEQKEATKLLLEIENNQKKHDEVLIRQEEVISDFIEKATVIIKQKHDIYKAKAKDRYEKAKKRLINEFYGIENWEKLQPNSRIFLITSRLVYEDLCNYEEEPTSFSPACLPITKAFENEMKKYFFDVYMSYLEDSKNYKVKDLPEGLTHTIKKDKKIIKIVKKWRQKFTLGDINRVTGVEIDFSNKHKKYKDDEKIQFKKNGTNVIIHCDKTLKDFEIFCKDKLFKDYYRYRSLKQLEEDVIDLMIQINIVRDKYRNKVAHTDEISMVQAQECYDFIINTEKVLVQFIKRLNRNIN